MADRPRTKWDRLPYAALYYPRYVRLAHMIEEEDGIAWECGQCPLHNDSDDSFRFEYVFRDSRPGGFWRCPQCGSGDMIDFHMRLTGKS